MAVSQGFLQNSGVAFQRTMSLLTLKEAILSVWPLFMLYLSLRFNLPKSYNILCQNNDFFYSPNRLPQWFWSILPFIPIYTTIHLTLILCKLLYILTIPRLSIIFSKQDSKVFCEADICFSRIQTKQVEKYQVMIGSACACTCVLLAWI